MLLNIKLEECTLTEEGLGFSVVLCSPFIWMLFTVIWNLTSKNGPCLVRVVYGTSRSTGIFCYFLHMHCCTSKLSSLTNMSEVFLLWSATQLDPIMHFHGESSVYYWYMRSKRKDISYLNPKCPLHFYSPPPDRKEVQESARFPTIHTTQTGSDVTEAHTDRTVLSDTRPAHYSCLICD